MTSRTYLRAGLVEPMKFNIMSSDLPPAPVGSVIVKVEATGVCGSDIHIFEGKERGLKFPIVPGHEIAGTVFELGPGVEGLYRSQKVTIIPSIPCGKCRYCKEHYPNLCENMQFIGAIGFDGGFAEFVIAPADCIIPVPDSLHFHQIVLIEPLAVGIHAARNSESDPADKISIVGAGPIGIACYFGLKGLGVKNVTLYDIDLARLDLARRFGADVMFSSEENPDSYARPDIVFECVGLEGSLRNAINLVKRHGKVILVGEHTQEVKVPLILIENFELSVKGCSMYTKDDFVRAIEFIQSTTIDVKSLITHRYPLSKISEAFEDIRLRRFPGRMKTVIEPNIQ